MMITVILLLAGGAIAAFMLKAIEKKRVDGKLTYPLWQGNILIPWVMFVALFAALIGGLNLPRFIGLVKHGTPVQGSVTEIKNGQYCTVAYSYAVEGKQYSDTDSFCGLKAGTPHVVYYDSTSPDISTLSLPRDALKDLLTATALICLSLPTVLVAWLRITYVIGGRKAA